MEVGKATAVGLIAKVNLAITTIQAIYAAVVTRRHFTCDTRITRSTDASYWKLAVGKSTYATMFTTA